MMKLYLISLLTLSFIWLYSGIISLINFHQSRELMQVIVSNPYWRDSLIIAGSITDIVLGLLLFHSRLRQLSLYLQIAVILFYTAIIAFFLPELFMHPFAPIIKNLAILILCLYLLRFQGYLR